MDGVAFLFGVGLAEQFVDNLLGVVFAEIAVAPVGEGAAGGADEGAVDADVGAVLQFVQQFGRLELLEVAVLAGGQGQLGIGAERGAVEFDLVAFGLEVQAAVENGGGNFAQFGFQLFLRDAGAALACHQVAEGLRGLDGEAVEVGVEADVLDEVFAGLRVEAALPGDFDAVDVISREGIMLGKPAVAPYNPSFLWRVSPHAGSGQRVRCGSKQPILNSAVPGFRLATLYENRSDCYRSGFAVFATKLICKSVRWNGF